MDCGGLAVSIQAGQLGLGEQGVVRIDRVSSAGMVGAAVAGEAAESGVPDRPHDEVHPAGRAVEKAGQEVPGLGPAGCRQEPAPVPCGGTGFPAALHPLPLVFGIPDNCLLEWPAMRPKGRAFRLDGTVRHGIPVLECGRVLLVHAAIALTDALTIKVGGVKSAGEDHLLAADLLESVLAMDGDAKRAIGHLRALIQEKTLVSSSGDIYRQEDIRRMARHLSRSRVWADRLLSA